MNRIVHCVALATALSASVAAVASQEGVLRLSSFRFASPGIGQSGPVVVSGEQDANRITALSVQAFGHTVLLSEHQLAKLRGGLVNGVQLSHEAGYPQLGGRVVYIVLSSGFTSGPRETQTVSVTEKGEVKVNAAARN